MMCLYALLAALLFVPSESVGHVRTVPSLEELPDDVLTYLVHQYVPADAGLVASCMRLRRAALYDATLSLNYYNSRRYIFNVNGFFHRANCTRRNPHKQVRLNLGEDFRQYVVNADFRAHVDKLVENPRKQIWSDVSSLDLRGAPVEDITALAGLVNLRQLDLAVTQVQDIRSLSGLVNLRQLDLTLTQVEDVSPLVGLTNLRYLYLGQAQVEDTSALADLPYLRILL